MNPKSENQDPSKLNSGMYFPNIDRGMPKSVSYPLCQALAGFLGEALPDFVVKFDVSDEFPDQPFVFYQTKDKSAPGYNTLVKITQIIDIYAAGWVDGARRSSTRPGGNDADLSKN